MDESGRVLHAQYRRHLSAVQQALTELTAELKPYLSKPYTLAVTGSAGMGIAQRANVLFLQEVVACAAAVRQYLPLTDTAIELGGEDAKITYFAGSLEQRMNGACAGGTGSFIDQMATLLSTDAAGLDALAAQGKELFPIASRCGVFAKTDVQSLMNEGVSREDLALSVLQAVVNQTITTLAQGRPIKGKVAFLGGPLHFLPQLKKRFIKTLGLKADEALQVDNACYFVALGAALCSAEGRTFKSAEELDYLIRAPAAIPFTMPADPQAVGSAALTAATLEPLFDNAAAQEAFLARHRRDCVTREALQDYRGALFLGIDAGSTTTKLALIGQQGQLLHTIYRSNAGSPLHTALTELKELYSVLQEGQQIACTLVTGYGESLIKAALHADLGEVETYVHLRAAREFCPQVSFVMDIGGQDMKCFYVHDGAIGNVILNEACSAGCGSFIETFAKSLGLGVEEFAALALQARAPVDLGTRCTVFMNSKVKQAQKDGSAVADISAGIAYSVVKNALFKVMQLREVSQLGEHIVVQGGTFRNQAVLRAMELMTGKEVICPDISGLMGAYGAALLARDKASAGQVSSLIKPEALNSFEVKTKTYRCKRCGNACAITMQRFPDGGKFYTGNRCEKGAPGAKSADDELNIYSYKYRRVFDYEPHQGAPRGVLGIPRVLNMYEDYPFWFTLFDTLGFEVRLSGESSAALYHSGMSTIPSDSICYPAKLVHGHIMDLIESGVKTIFYPCLPYNMRFDAQEADNHFNCPVVASYPENIRGNMDILQERRIRFLQPFLPIDSPRRLARRLRTELRDQAIQVGRRELIKAVRAAYAELERYRAAVRARGELILSELKRTGGNAIVLAGRPYHIDPEINHGIPAMISSYGLAVLSEDALYHLKVAASRRGLVNQWSYHARLYHAAQYTAEHPELSLIQLSSFGCGLDAITTDQVKGILEDHRRIYTMIKLDEVSNLGAARIRLRSLLAALSEKKPPHFESITYVERPHFVHECGEGQTILAPQMLPLHFELFKEVLHHYGYNVIIPELPGQGDIDQALRYINNDMCYPAIVVAAQMIKALRSGRYDPEQSSIMLFQTCGACRATNYISVLRRALHDAGFPQVPVFALYGLDTDDFKLTLPMFRDAVKASVYADLLMGLKNRVEPYEQEAGATQRLTEKWLRLCAQELTKPSLLSYARHIRRMVRDFEALPIDEQARKPKVGIVGEILVKYHPVANNFLERVLLSEGAEVVMPEFLDFILYLAGDNIIEHDLLSGRWRDKTASLLFVRAVERYRKPVTKALRRSQRFSPPRSIKETAALASRHVSLGNMAGEGWFLTGEMVKLIESGVENIVCLQPFGCLPNHITGKGVVHPLRSSYPQANIVTIDCDAGASEVNQLNRLKLMLAEAKRRRDAD